MRKYRAYPPRFIDSNEDIPEGEMTFWVCRRCHVVKMYTEDELRKVEGGIPICIEGIGHETDGLLLQSYFMQRIK